MALLDDYLYHLRASTLFQRWAQANPGEKQRLDSFATNPSGSLPSMLTEAGKAFVRGVKGCAGTTAPVPTPSGHTRATLKPPGSALSSSLEAAARVRRHTWEIRPANQRFTIAATQLPARGSNELERRLWARVDGDFKGTTDETIQWAAHKWGFDEDWVRAQMALESNWNQEALGDYVNGVPESIGIGQVRCNVPNAPHRVAYPMAKDSMAFNLDYGQCFMRCFFEGAFAHWWPGDTYWQSVKGDYAKSLSAYYSPAGRDVNSWYFTQVKARFEAKPWLNDSAFFNKYAQAGPWPTYG